jgi:hypothetical protein
MTQTATPLMTDPNTEVLKAATNEQKEQHKQLSTLIHQCTGSEEIHRINRMMRYFVVTDGILEMVKTFAAYWFCDLVGSHSPRIMQRDHFAVVELTVQANRSAKFIAHDGREPRTEYAQQPIPYTDFPIGVWKFYLSLSEDAEGSPLHVLMQTSEN